MMRHPPRSTTQLPRALRDQLGLKDSNKTLPQARRANGGEVSRKDCRKAERLRNGIGTKSFERPGKWKRHKNERGSSEGELLVEASNRAMKPTTSKPEKPKSILKKTVFKEPDHSDFEINLDEGESEDEISVADQPSLRPTLSRKVQEKLAEDDEEIAALEKKLGLKGKKKLPQSFAEDGLGEILGELGSDSDTNVKKRRREGELWLQRKRQKAQVATKTPGEYAASCEETSEDEKFEFDELLAAASSEEDSNDDQQSAFEGFEDNDFQPEELGPQVAKHRENPYRPPVAATSTSTKYAPPSKRGLSTESEPLLRLRRQIQGHLNKLSESNLVSILGDIEKLYRDNSRQSVTSIIIELLLGLTCSGSSLNDTFIILHAGFVSAIYKIIGMEFGAQFVQTIVEHFDNMYQGIDQEESDKRDMTNLLSILSQLYNFHLIGCGLIFDYIRLFLRDINEFNTELLLKIVKNSGPQLRQDDPSALKDIVLLIQPTIARIGEASLSVRTRFMIEMINDLKNNKLKTAPGASISLEHIIKMRKILGSLSARNIRASEPLRICRDDIHNSEKRGKWWLVGSSWKSGPLDNTEPEKSRVSSNVVLPDTLDDNPDAGASIDLAQLARTHRMNTEVRRSIFVAIMSATDYQDAHVRLTKLRLKRNQEHEIPQVLIHCASMEEAYNPYYTLIARRLCAGERRMKMAFQFSLWDVFKRMSETGGAEDEDFTPDEDDSRSLSMRAVVNLAKMYGTLIADGGLGIGILKTLDFLYLQPKTKTYVEVLLITIMQETQPKIVPKKRKAALSDREDFAERPLEEVFLKSQETPQVIPGLIYFLREVVSRSDAASSKQEKKLVTWGCKLALDTLKSVSGGKEL